MTFTTTPHGYIIRLFRGEKVIETLTDFCARQAVTCGVFSAIGAVEQAELSFYDLPTKTYESAVFPEAKEVVSMTGNVAVLAEKPFLHTHVVLSDSSMQPVGGHLKEAIVAVTLEVYLTVFDVHVSRTFDDTTGLNLLDFHSHA
jgi:predicted DNA-binding protein with PD1-like motif